MSYSDLKQISDVTKLVCIKVHLERLAVMGRPHSDALFNLEQAME